MVKPIPIKFVLGGFNEVINKQKNLNKLIREGKKEASKGETGKAGISKKELAVGTGMTTVYGKITSLTDKQTKMLKEAAGYGEDNLKTLNDEEDRLNVLLSQEEKRLNLAKDYLFHQQIGTKEYEEANQILQKQKNNVEGIKARFGDVVDRVTTIQGPLSKLFSYTPLRFLDGWVKRAREVNVSFQKIGGQGGFVKNLSQWFLGASITAATFSKTLKVIWGGSMIAMMGNFGKLLRIIKIGIVSLLKSLSGILLPIAAIIAGIYLLKKAWDWNIGGIQTKWATLIGRLKSIWGKFQVALMTAMRIIGPMFAGVFNIIAGALGPVVKGLEWLVSIFQNMPGYGKTATKVILGIAGALLIMSTSWGLTGIIIGGVLYMFGKLPKWGKAVGLALGIMTLAIWAFSTALWANPLVWFVAVIVGAIAVIVGIVYAIKNWGRVTEWLGEKFGKIGAWVKKVVKWFGGWKQMILSMISPLYLIGKIFAGIKLPDWLQKVVNWFTGGAKAVAGGEAGKALGASPEGKQIDKVKELRQVKETALSSQVSTANTWNNQKKNIINTSNNVTIHSSGAIDEKQAPRIGDILVNTLQKSSPLY